MEIQLKKYEQLQLRINSCDPYSSHYLVIQVGHVYSFQVNPAEVWYDWFVKTNADGFKNIFLKKNSKRVPGSKCFKLCATLELNEQGHFPIGTKCTWIAKESGNLYFFANDSKKLNKRGEFKYYKKNKGFINLEIQRIS